MRNKPLRALGFALLLLCSASLAGGLGSREKKREAPRAEDTETPERRVRVSGRVRLVGGGPFPQMVITGEDREWYIEREEESKLLDLQQRLVTVEGTESYRDLNFANGSPAGRRYTLKNIKVTEKR
jgi:hypothetical protein